MNPETRGICLGQREGEDWKSHITIIKRLLNTNLFQVRPSGRVFIKTIFTGQPSGEAYFLNPVFTGRTS